LTTKRTLTRWAGLLATTAIIVAACSGTDGGASAAPSADGGTGEFEQWVPDPARLEKAKAEGTLSTIALPDSWCNYRETLDTFAERTGLTLNELNPDAGSADELTAIEANKDNPGPQAPDVIDVGLSFGPEAMERGLIRPYKVAQWDEIPDTAKDPDGYWYGDYYGVLAFEVNTGVVDNVPADWGELTGDYKNQVALAGDPRASNQAIQTVYASALANGGSLDDAQPGLDFWKKVVDAGNFVPTIANAGTIAQGETPITVRWTYNALSNRDEAAAAGGDAQIEVVVPESGRFAGVYVQAISAFAPHPNAAELWMDWLYSDEGQNTWLKGYCHPIRYEALVTGGRVPQAQLDKLPDVTGAVFPTLAQLTAASDLITAQWDTVVGVDVVDATP
jgi:putative spermidine/putrescine transport system substrate-binding protein